VIECAVLKCARRRWTRERGEETLTFEHLEVNVSICFPGDQPRTGNLDGVRRECLLSTEVWYRSLRYGRFRFRLHRFVFKLIQRCDS
jgi:hypothetical protein